MCVNDNERRNKPRNDVTNEFSVRSEVPNYIRVTDFEKEKSASVHLAHLFRHTHSQNKVPEELVRMILSMISFIIQHQLACSQMVHIRNANFQKLQSKTPLSLGHSLLIKKSLPFPFKCTR